MLVGAWLISLGAIAASELEDVAKARLQNLSGQIESLQFPSNTKAVVFLFLSVECPISNSYAPEIRRIGAEFGPKDVLIKLIYPNVDETAEAVKKHVKEFDLPFPALRDIRHDLVKASHVRATPEAALFVPKVGFVYHGRIDNRYADLGVARPQATEHDLRDALAAVIAGKRVPRTSSPAIGCSIAPL